jgi:PAS domain S-box-containing protein
MMRAVGSASPMMRLVAATAAFAGVYFLVAVLTRLVIGDSGLAVLWPASGVYLGVMLVAPREKWSALACGAWIGSLAAYLHAGSSLEVSVAFAVPSSAEGLLGALLVERIAGKRFTLRTLHDVFALVLGGAVIANALVGLSAGAVAAQTFGVSFGESWLSWWSADALGVIAVAPIITAPRRPRGLRTAAVGGLGVALVVAHFADAQVHIVQAFLAALLLSLLALAVALTERERALTESERVREGTTEKLDESSQRVAQLTAELAARSAELHDAGRRRERLDEELGHTRRALAQAVAERDRVQRELDDSAFAMGRLQEKLGDAASELANARAAARALENELESTRAEQARTSEQLAGAMSDRERVEQELERLGARFEDLRAELERTQWAHGQANEALEKGRAQFAEQRRALEEELSEAMSGRERVEQELERLGARFDNLRGELERTQWAHGQANAAPEQGRAQFVAQRQRLERSLEDVTRRLARAEAERRLLADRATELSSRYDDRGICLDASPAFCQLLGYEREELVGRPGAELLHVEDRPRLVRARATRSEGRFEARLRRKAGDFVWVEVTLHPVWDRTAQRLVEIQTSFRDVSEKRTATQTAA